jgi:putative addiction module killer protein
VYFGRRGRELVLLLTGGDKKSQKKDIKRAKELWRDYLKEQTRGKTQ